MKTCTKCKNKKDLKEFYKRSNGKGTNSHCKECIRLYMRNRQKNDPTVKERQKEGYQNLRIEVLSAYSNGNPKCSCCGTSHIEFLALDHIDGGGTKERKKVSSNKLYRNLRRENYPNGFRVLCHNCNTSIGLYGYCPCSK